MDSVIVYIEFLNYAGEVTESTEIARFRSESWAEDFISTLKPDSSTRYRILAGDKEKIIDGGGNLAERIYNIIPPWDRDGTVQDIEETIQDDPKAIINYLLEIIENN